MKLLLRGVDPALYTFCPSDLWALWLTIVGAFVLYWLTVRLTSARDRAIMLKIVFLGFALRVAVSWTQHRVFPQLLSSGFAADTILTHRLAAQQVRLWQQGGVSIQTPRSLSEWHFEARHLKTSLLYYLFAPNPLVAEAILVTMGATVILATYLLGTAIGVPPDASRAGALLVAVLPSLSWYAAQDLRDPVECFAMTWSSVAFVRLLERRSIVSSMLLLVIMDLVAIGYRPYVGLLLAGGHLAGAAVSIRLNYHVFPKLIRVFIIGAAAVVGALTAIREIAAVYFPTTDTGAALLVAASQGAAGASPGSTYIIRVAVHGPIDAIYKLPILTLLLLLSPVPVVSGSPAKVATYPEMWFIYLYVVPRFVAGVRAMWKHHRRLLVCLLLSILPIIAAYAVRVGAAGVAIRMRTQFLPVLLLIAGIGAAMRARRRLQQTTLAESLLYRAKEGMEPQY